MNLEVHVCPICRKLYVYRKRGGCPQCGQLIARKREFWGPDHIYEEKNGFITYEEGLKMAKKRK